MSHNRATRQFAPWLILVSISLAAAVTLNFHAWALSPTHATTCSCSDTSLTTWFLGWPWAPNRQNHAIWFCRSMFFPQGTNLLAKTGYLGLGLVSLPITAVFGPLARFDTWLVVGPVITTLAMTRFATRLTSNFVAAALSGLFFAFSPLVI